MRFAFGDIYYADCDPSTGHEYQGERPVLVVQENSTSVDSPVVTIMPMTSQLHQLSPSDVIVGKNNKNRLELDSAIKVQHIYSFDKRRFRFRIGQADSPVIRQVRGYLRRHFGM